MIGNNIWAEDTRSKLLHIYGQTHHHGSARIHGSPDALRRLGNALIAASRKTQCDDAVMIEMMASDGEGYGVLIRPMSDQQMDQAEMPYCTPGFHWPLARIGQAKNDD